MRCKTYYNQRQAPFVCLGQLAFRLGHQGIAPVLSRWEWVRVQEEFVRGHGISRAGPLQGGFLVHAVGPEGIIVEREDGRDYDPRLLLAASLPLDKVVLGGVHAVPARDLDALGVLVLAAQRRLERHGVQLVVAGAPPDALELARRRPERQLQVRGRLAHVAAQDQPVARVLVERLPGLRVERVPEVDVAYGV